MTNGGQRYLPGRMRHTRPRELLGMFTSCQCVDRQDQP
jgi:hypothetical protein